MSLLGIDVGTTGTKAAAFTTGGHQLASAYVEYDFRHPAPGWAELDSAEVWRLIQDAIRRVVADTASDPIRAISVSSMGEAMVPVSQDRQILGPSINPNFDLRGEGCLQLLASEMDNERLYRLNGNTLGHHYSLPTLKWLKEHQPDRYRGTHKFLLWGSLVPYMLGAEPGVDFSLANRTLLFDLEQGDWSAELLDWAGLDRDKLPDTTPSGTMLGRVSRQAAEDLGLSPGVVLVAGCHDQCANAVGCGVIQEGQAVYGMGTFFCITPVFGQRRDPALMLERGLNTEHHAVPGLYVSFLYNPGGVLVKWYRDTFAALDHARAQRAGTDIYEDLFAEMPEGPGRVLVLPHFAPTGPPGFIADSRGVMVGLQLQTTRGDILKGLIEGIAFYLKEVVDSLPATGIQIQEYRATGGGAKSAAWIQVLADIMGQPVIRPRVTEAGALGAAILAGVGSGAFASFREGVEAMVDLDRTFEPDPGRHQQYQQRFQKHRDLWPLLQDYLRELAANGA
jgi:xylulokinase